MAAKLCPGLALLLLIAVLATGNPFLALPRAAAVDAEAKPVPVAMPAAFHGDGVVVPAAADRDELALDPRVLRVVRAGDGGLRYELRDGRVLGRAQFLALRAAANGSADGPADGPASGPPRAPDHEPGPHEPPDDEARR